MKTMKKALSVSPSLISRSMNHGNGFKKTLLSGRFNLLLPQSSLGGVVSPFSFSTLSSSNIRNPTFLGSLPSMLNVDLVSRNTSTTQGRLVLNLPLPGLKGLTALPVADETTTVQDVINMIKKVDPSLKTVEISNISGVKVARTVQMRELTTMEFFVRLNHVNVLIQNARTTEESRVQGEGVRFASIKSAIEKDSRAFIPLEEYYNMCINAGAEEAVANKWLRELQRRDIVVHFDRSKHEELKNAIILRPKSSESIFTLQNVLDSELYNLKHEMKVKESRHKELKSSLKKLLSAQDEAKKAAKNIPNVYKWLGFTASTTFYGSLMYLVWDVYSWDVMEPITYFISFTAVLGNSFYHSITKKDPSYTNMWQKKYHARLQALYDEKKISPEKIEALQLQLRDVEKDVELLDKLIRH